MRRRVVITGIGATSGYGVGARGLWDNVCQGRSALSVPTRLNMSGFACQLAAELKDFSAKDYVPKGYRKAVKVMARDVELAVACAKECVEDAGLHTRAHEGSALTYAPERVGCQIGAGLISAETQELTMALATAVDPGDSAASVRGGFSYKKFGTVQDAGGGGGMDNLQPLWMLKYLPNMLACHVTIIHGCEGPSNTITCAEASGLLCIGEGSRVIERGAADVTLSGSAESKLSLMGVLRLTVAGRLGIVPATSDPQRAIAPFASVAAGSCPGEGGGLLVLEDQRMARERGVRAYAEVAGFGAGHSLGKTTPGTQGDASAVNEGLVVAINAALKDAGVGPNQIDAIVPQGCGAACMDGPERGALEAIFGGRLGSTELVTLTPFVGDCCAGTGGLQTVVAALCLHEQRLPARLGQDVAGLRTGRVESRTMPLEHVLICTSSLGGQNAALVLRRVR